MKDPDIDGVQEACTAVEDDAHLPVFMAMGGVWDSLPPSAFILFQLCDIIADAYRTISPLLFT